MLNVKDGPGTPNFKPVSIAGTHSISDLSKTAVSEKMKRNISFAPEGDCVSWGIPFKIKKTVLISEKNNPVTIKLNPLKTEWLIFMHTSDEQPFTATLDQFSAPSLGGAGRLGEHAANYIVNYSDGTEHKIEIKRRHHIGAFQRPWGENCFECVPHRKPRPIKPHHEQALKTNDWGWSQCRVGTPDAGSWINWLWAFENPYPDKEITGIRFEPINGNIIVSGISAGKAAAYPLRWETRCKAVLKLPKNTEFDPALDDSGLLKQIQLDMGQIISAQKRLIYPDNNWTDIYKNFFPEISQNEIIIEYTAHKDARFHLLNNKTIQVSKIQAKASAITYVPPANQKVKITVIDKKNHKPVPCRLHIHGTSGEYCAPVDRHRIPNQAWYEDYSVDYVFWGKHCSTYIPGETTINLPLGNVYIEISRGFEIKPVRKKIKIKKSTNEIIIPLEKILNWREKGWVSADTHVHFLSPQTALFEGTGEDLNIINLLASQWGELMTNVGDFDGKTTLGSKESGGSGEYLVRVGTENRQYAMGHISLIGYKGNIIAPMTTGGPQESAIGDPVGKLLTEWAAQCKKQGGIVVIPHFPNPRLENAAAIVSGNVDGIEFCRGINPYPLVNWYKYLNCGYMTAAVSGTDKMAANVTVGYTRTYAYIGNDKPFTYEAWLEAVRHRKTFVSCGPLMEFSVEGKSVGSKIELNSTGGTITINWKAASLINKMTKIELIVNGEIKESRAIKPDKDEGYWSIKIDKSSWVALLIRGHYPENPKAELIMAHSSPVMIEVAGTELFSKIQALSILEQIEGAMAYLDTVGTRAETKRYKQMRLILESAHRTLHNRLHQLGHYHKHSPMDEHPEHKK